MTKPVRLSAEARRKTLLEAASSLLSEFGSEGLQIHDVAERAGVSRPIVYRFFDTRDALVVALLEDMAQTLERRMKDALLVVALEDGARARGRAFTGKLDDAVRAMVEACCDAIVEKGAGPWRMLDARGASPEHARAGRAIHERLLAPWQPLIREHTGLPSREVELLLSVVVAAGRAALDGWIDARLSRARAVDAATRAVRTLIAEFSVQGS